MQANESVGPAGPTCAAPRPFLKKQLPEDIPVTPQSTALFRFGEQCNYHCPMCSNTGEAGIFFHPTDELLRRAAFLHGCGFRRVVVTGGEATIHPGFWTVVEQLAAYGMKWDTNTHGGSFARPGFAQRAVATGLERAIVSLHSLHGPTSAAIFGTRESAHEASVAGVDSLIEAGVDVMLNCVLSRLNVGQLEDYLTRGYERFARKVAFKFVFPSTIGKGGQWPEIATLRYAEVGPTMLRIKQRAARLGARIYFESFPNCILHDAGAVNYSRSTFGETHYLDDASGNRVYSMRHIEAELSAFGEVCQDCTALRACPGVALRYAQRWGVDELTPFR